MIISQGKPAQLLGNVKINGIGKGKIVLEGKGDIFVREIFFQGDDSTDEHEIYMQTGNYFVFQGLGKDEQRNYWYEFAIKVGLQSIKDFPVLELTVHGFPIKMSAIDEPY